MAKAAVKAIELSFKLEKETSGALRYQEVNAEGAPLTNADGAKVGTLYVRKTAMPDGAWANLDVTIKARA